ncbi:MAG: asparagine synthase (glutamine-hydrolyzing) [Pyrinomonadaceae bacterium]
MCGINGIAYSARSNRQADEAVLCAMRDEISHRGPDDAGVFVKGNIGLGHRRLSIVDVAHGHQPMVNSDGSCVLVYNGEVYNHADHRGALESKGYKYRTTSDTETILYLYEEFGEACVEKLRGMFAFAIWDENKKQLFAARDRLGIKPLYYVYDEEGNFFFASEIKSLIKAGAVKPELNYAVLPDQLANHGTSYDQTLYKGVKRLMPGHHLTWKDGRISIKKYWDISYEPKHEGISDREYIDEWRERFRRSVELRLMADVPLGMFLSGGIDSSAICALMAEMVDEPIRTFSVGFDEKEANEFEYARTVSKAYKTDHHEVLLTPAEFFRELPNLIRHEDEPLGFVASVPLYFVSKLAQKHVKVVLTGEGSDELMAGYGRYAKTLKLLQYGEKYETFAPDFLRNAVRSGVSTLPGSVSRKLKRTFLTREADIESLFFDNFSIFSRSMQEELLSPDSIRQIHDTDPFALQKRWFEENDAIELLDKILYCDTKTYLHELLMKQDQMSMAASIESRVPFLDHELVEYTSRMPVNMKIRGRTTKWILREAMKGILPDEILTRPKMGFPVPIGNWLRNEFRYLLDQFVLSERALSRGIFEKDFIRRLVNTHDAGEDHSLRLFFLLNFEIWHRQMIEGENVEISCPAR